MDENAPERETESLPADSDPAVIARRYAAQRAMLINDPERIGPYRIRETLGEGGMGIVYLAEQDKPLHRRVALKIIKLGMDTKAGIGRFETERAALALMNHPNVAKVFDAGATEQGRPYFVMEYVPGIPITEYCDRHRLTTEERLRLFMDVCHAIQHAHQNGIIHRDIKPSNVLVSVAEAKPVPKVIDFGVAKATQHRLIERTFFTEQGQLIGTPGYMSPEQAELTALDIDTRTDVYSLGVLLYELLVGELPFDTRSLRRGGLAEIQRIIREVDPPKPSTRLSEATKARRREGTKEDDPHDGAVEDAEHRSSVEQVARKRRTEPRTLIRQIRGDLDVIAMKCLEKNRTRRYATANDLSADILRHLGGEPIEARPRTWAYIAGSLGRRQMKRHPTTAMLICLAVSVGGSALLCDPVLNRWTDLDRRFESWLTHSFLEPMGTGQLSRVRVIGITDQTDIARLAAEEKLPDVSPAEAPSWRPLHGRMMERLIQSGCLAVVWAYRFRAPMPGDQEFAAGVRALKRAGTPVVVGVEKFWSGDRDLPTLSPTIAAEVQWGSGAGFFFGHAPWHVPLVVRRGPVDTLASLGLQALAAARTPGRVLRFRMDLHRQLVFLVAPSESSEALASYWTPVDRVRVAEIDVVEEVDRDPPRYGLAVGDSWGTFPVSMPADAVLRASTLDYEAIFHDSPAELRNKLRGRVAVVGGLRADAVDRFEHPDGRTIAGVYGQAVAIDALLRSVFSRLPDAAERWLCAALGAVFGIVVGFGLPGRVMLRMAAIVCGVGLSYAAAVGLCRSQQFVFNPASLAVAALLSCVLAAGVRRVADFGSHFQPKGT